jgi:hypothetical protein
MSKFEDDEVLQYLSKLKPREEDKRAFWMVVCVAALALAIPGYQCLTSPARTGVHRH